MSINAFVRCGTAESSRPAEEATAAPREYIDWVATGTCFAVGSLGPLLFGFDLGVSPGALRAVMSSATLRDQDRSPGEQWEAWAWDLLPAISMCGALAISFVILLAGNLLGRRTELLLAAVCYGASTILCRFACSLRHLLYLRALYGVAMGISMHSSAPFIAETCPASVRGMLISLKEAMLVGGILKGYLVAHTFLETPEGWKNMYTAAAPVALAMAVGVWFVPESPRWLLLKDWQKARAAARAGSTTSSAGRRSSLRRLPSAPTISTDDGIDSGASSPPMLSIIEHSQWSLASPSHAQQAEGLWQRQQLLMQQGGAADGCPRLQPSCEEEACGSSLWVFDPQASPPSTSSPERCTPQQHPLQPPCRRPGGGPHSPGDLTDDGMSSFSQASPRSGSVQCPADGAARLALARAWGNKGVLHPEQLEREMVGMALSAKEASLYGVTGMQLLAHPLYYRPLAAGILMMLFSQVTGQPAVMYESSKILGDAGVTQGQDEVLGAFRFLMTIIAAANVDIWGRRPMLLLGASGIVLALGALAATQWEAISSLAGPEEKAWVSVLAMLFFLGCFQVSFGPISWLYIGEIFPLAVRGPAIAAANVAGCSSSLVVQLLLPYLHNNLGPSGSFVLFTMLSLFAALTVYLIVPETKGKSLEEIELDWGGDRGLPSSIETASLSEWLL